MFPSTEPCIRDTTRRSEEKKKTKTIYQLYFHANEIFAFIGHMRPMEQFLFFYLVKFVLSILKALTARLCQKEEGSSLHLF